MNGPFQLRDWGAVVLDADGEKVAEGCGATEEKEQANAQLVCDALNAVYYSAKATGSAA